MGFFRFVFVNLPDSLALYLQTSPGDEEVRRRPYEMGHKDESLFDDLIDPEISSHPNLYSRTFLTPELYEDASEDDRAEEIRRHWTEFTQDDLPRIQAALKEERWIWEYDASDEGLFSGD